MDTADALANPILNRPYDAPEHYFEIGPSGPTGVIRDGRRASESLIPIASSRKGVVTAEGHEQTMLEAGTIERTAERRELNKLINDLRVRVERWRRANYPGVTATTAKLLRHWTDPNRENRIMFCQREAAETAIFLAEVAGKRQRDDWLGERVNPFNEQHNDGLPRIALKMATGSGKTVVMAMLIAWQTANAVNRTRAAQSYSKRFLVVTPGITIRDRLRVLRPGEPGNYYDERDLVPPELQGALRRAQIVIANYHAFLLRDAKELDGVSATTRKILTAGKFVDPFRETPNAMVSRVLRDLGNGNEPVVVINDEAHHCYQDKPLSTGGVKLSKEEQAANADARVWFKGLQAVAAKAGITTIYDLSATPYYLSGSGYNEGYIFPWTVSDFSLMDAIESGIVKIPRTPVDDDAQGELVTYLRLWDFVGKWLPKRRQPDGAWIPPEELKGALVSLHRSYRRTYEHWARELKPYDAPPPVFIVVCPNTVVSKLVYDWIAGIEVEGVWRSGELELLSNVVDGKPLARPVTILVDSARLESGEALTSEFKAAAAAEIDLFKEQLHGDEEVTDEELLREVMNTVGKPGKLGENIRCVVSVAMLTEGWDANTVSHILGVRAFRSQLLCEQVVGRGLRRRNYDIDPDTGCFSPEYANIYGVPFAFLPDAPPIVDPKPPLPATPVFSVPGREHLRIEFPKVDGYRIEIPDEDLHVAEERPRFVIGPNTVPTRTDIAGIVGRDEVDTDVVGDQRLQAIAFLLARQCLSMPTIASTAGDRLPWRFARLVQISRDWLRNCVDVAPGFSLAQLQTSAQLRARAVEAIVSTIVIYNGQRRRRLQPMLRRFDPVGSTGNVSFLTRKVAYPTTKCEISHVPVDGKGGNTWEYILQLLCEGNDDIAAYAKNDRLDFTIPYIHEGKGHLYYPDFLVRLTPRSYETLDRTLIVEVSGSQKSPGPTQAKADTARNQWCVAVNNLASFGRWGFVEITSMVDAQQRLVEAIEALYADDPIIGDSDLMDLSKLMRGEHAPA